MLVGGNDKTINIYKFEGGKLSKQNSIVTDSPPRSIDLFNGKLLMGYKNGSISELDYAKAVKANPRARVIMTSHCDGEVWGVEVCHLDNGEVRMITSGDDNRILAYNPKL